MNVLEERRGGLIIQTAGERRKTASNRCKGVSESQRVRFIPCVPLPKSNSQLAAKYYVTKKKKGAWKL
jgi:hypothetical protein